MDACFFGDARLASLSCSSRGTSGASEVAFERLCVAQQHSHACNSEAALVVLHRRQFGVTAMPPSEGSDSVEVCDSVDSDQVLRDSPEVWLPINDA